MCCLSPALVPIHRPLPNIIQRPLTSSRVLVWGLTTQPLKESWYAWEDVPSSPCVTPCGTLYLRGIQKRGLVFSGPHITFLDAWASCAPVAL